MSNDTPGSEALDMLGWEPLETRRAKTKAVHMYKVLNGLAPSSLADLFVPKSDITEYDLRGSHTSLQLPHPKTEKLKRSFSYSEAMLWNSLPTDLRNSNTLTDFMEYALSAQILAIMTGSPGCTGRWYRLSGSVPALHIVVSCLNLRCRTDASHASTQSFIVRASWGEMLVGRCASISGIVARRDALSGTGYQDLGFV